MSLQDTAWERYTPEEIRKALSTDLERGLSSKEVKSRRRLQGKNVFSKERGLGLLGKIFKQFANPLVFILLGAGIITLFLREYVDTVVIFAALMINITVGTFQEARASRAFEKLSRSQERFATVFRDGRKMVVPAEELVTGDLVVIEAGSYVPADIRLMSSANLSVNEAALTGEWVAVEKEAIAFEQSVPITEQFNMAWMETLVADGAGAGIVVATGNRTKVGAIAASLGGIDESVTPLQQNIRHIAKLLMYVVIAAVVAIFILGTLRGEAIGEMLLIAIALAVATMPEGLPAAVTIVLALGMESILKRGGLVRNLLAAETLGATTIILTDKTGTLTEAKMQLASIYTKDTLEEKSASDHSWTLSQKSVLEGALLASDAFVEESERQADTEQPHVVVHGRPIERAVVRASLEAGISQEVLMQTHPRADFLPFASKRRFGASLHDMPNRKTRRLYLTGTPEYLLAHATHAYDGGKAPELSESVREQFETVQEKRSAEGMRFIGVAYKDAPWERIPKTEEGEVPTALTEKIVFLGFIAFEDPVRSDVAEAIERVQGAHARVLMVTGDNPETARKVACDVGISCAKDDVRLGSEIEKLSDDALYEELSRAKIFARVLPEAKLRIARVLKNKGEIVAMTGDGVNDAPALRSANIGVAVGSGTEVAKEAADMVLINNSFSIIVSAIEEGRKIIDNLKKIIAYLLSTSFSEVIVIGGALAVGAPLPLLPGQILWANIVEEGLMSFPLAFEKGDANLMKRDPRAHDTRRIVTTELKRLIVAVSLVTGAFLMALYFFLLRQGLPIEEVRTVMFVALSLDAMFFVFSLKSLDQPLWKINPFDNRYLLGALAASLALLVLAVTLEPLRFLLSLTVLTPLEVLLLVGVGFFNLLTIEVAKHFIFKSTSIANT